MPRYGRDQAGNLWELDANGNPVRYVPATPAMGAPTVVPPNPAIVAQKQREQARQDAADMRAERADRRAAAAEARAEKDFESKDTMVPPPGDTTKTGEDYLATVSPSLAAQARALIDGRRAFPTGAALRSPAVQQLIAVATQADPTLDATNSFTRVATRKDFTSGKAAQNITALNTALGHLGQLWTDAQALHNRGLVPWNAVANAVESAGGDPRLNNFNLTRKAVADELERVFRQAGGNVSEINEWKSTLSSSSSPEQFRGSMAQAVGLLNSRLEALSAQYSQGMGHSADPVTFLKPHALAVFNALQEGGSGVLPGAGPSTPPTIGGGGPKGPPGSLGGGRSPAADYSSMVGGPQSSVAIGPMRNEYDPVMAGAVSAFIKKGAPYETVAAYASSHGFTPPDPKAYRDAVGFAAAHGGATNVEANRLVPTTLGERLSASPAAAALVGAGTAATAGLSDVAGRSLLGPEWDANRAALAATNPGADLAGNVAGGIAANLVAPALAARYVPGSLGLAGRAANALERFSPALRVAAPDALYGATYGASENPNDPVMGGLTGAATGVGAGIVGRKAAGGLANIIAPPAGEFGPLFEAGIRPTPGQRFARSGLAGRILNGTEQAMQSLPIFGAAPASARQASRDAFQVGAFNNSLKELQPFTDLGVNLPTSLPANVGPGTQAHAITNGAFDHAYDVARSGMRMVPDPTFEAQDAAFHQQLGSSGLLSTPQAEQVGKVINNAVHTRLNAAGGQLGGDAYKAASADLGRTIQLWSKDPAKADMASALSDYQSIFDDAARRNSDPTAVNLLDAADRGYAQFVRIQRASEMGGAGKDAGTFTPTNYAGAVKQQGGGLRSNAYNRGNALGQDYANAGLNLRETLADSGTPMRLGVIGALQGAEGAGLALTGHLGMLANPQVAGAFAPYLPGVRRLTNAIIAPRQYTLPPVLADPLNLAGSKINDLAPIVGRAAVPGALAYYGVAQ